MTTPGQRKGLLRREALARRDALPQRMRIEAALDIAETGSRHIGFDPGTIVSGFWPMRSEVDVRPLLSALGERGARLCLPAILDRSTIVFRQLVRGAPMVEMGYGTYGPAADAEELVPQIMLVPLAAFDRRGHRIGYGAGYYDRAIARIAAGAASLRPIGIAFDCQEVDEVPDEPHDVVIPEVLTESGLRRLGLGL